MTAYVALLRAVNVGGTKVVMKELRALFVDLGYADATTYLQSGNVVFTGPADAEAALASEIRERMAADLGVDAHILVRGHDHLATVVAGNPYLDRTDDPTKLHVTFLAEPSAEPDRLVVPPGETAELTLAGRDVYLYCPDGYGRTKLNNMYLERRLRVPATTRNWRTVTTLCEMTSG